MLRNAQDSENIQENLATVYCQSFNCDLDKKCIFYVSTIKGLSENRQEKPEIEELIIESEATARQSALYGLFS